MWCCFTLFGKKAFSITFVLCLLLDGACCLAIFLLQQQRKHVEPYTGVMTSDTIDCFVSFILRAVALPTLGAIGVHLWRRTAHPHSRRSQSSVRGMNSELGISLRDAGVDEEAGGVMSNGSSPRIPGLQTGSSFASDVSDKEFYEIKMEERKRMDSADKRRNILLVVGFVVITMIAVYNGLKSVVFRYDVQMLKIQGALLGSCLLWANLEYFLMLNIVMAATKDEGERIPALHMHPLYFTTNLKLHYCDICHEKTKGPHYEAYRCRTCDFDLCSRCYRRKDKPSFKGMALRRSDEAQSLSTWSYFYRIVQMAMGFWMLLLLAISCLIISQALYLTAPNLQGRIFDSIISYLKGDTASDEQFSKVIELYLLVNVLMGLFNGARSLTTELVKAKIQASVREKLFQAIVRMDIAFFDAMHTGQLTSRLTNDTNGMSDPLQVLMNDLVANAILLFGGAFMAFYTSWKLSILALTVVPPITVCYRVYAEWGRKINRAIYQYYGDSNSVATECLSNIRTVRAFSTEMHEIGRYHEGVRAALRAGISNAFVGASVNMFSSYVNLAASVLILWYGGQVIFDTHGSQMTIGDLITFQLYWNMMNSAFLSLGNVFNSLIRASSAAERVCSLMDAEPEVDPDAGADVDPSTIKGHVVLQNLHFFYKTRPENQVLRGINLDLVPGSTTALVGKSGGGKSTLVHLLLRFYDPTDGTVLLDGQDMRTLKSRQVRKAVGFVAQETQLFATSIEENIAYGLGKSYSKEELHEAARQANAHDFIMEMEEGYETRVGEKGVMLSGGQKQRISIARCFLRQPKLLFLDEATSALDAENEALVQAALDKLIDVGSCTVVLIAHRLSTVMGATQIAVVHKGMIAEVGNHAQLVEHGGIYAQLVSRQMKRDEDKLVEEDKDTSGALPLPASANGHANKGKANSNGNGKGGKGKGKGTKEANVTSDNVDALFDELDAGEEH